jgi:hypothetical protein
LGIAVKMNTGCWSMNTWQVGAWKSIFFAVSGCRNFEFMVPIGSEVLCTV